MDIAKLYETLTGEPYPHGPGALQALRQKLTRLDPDGNAGRDRPARPRKRDPEAARPA